MVVGQPHLASARQAGYTLVEILVATTLALLLMAGVITMFGNVGESITNSRAMLESADRLRLAEARLQMDLAGITATVAPPLKPENNEGYFEYIEGPVGTSSNMIAPSDVAVNSDDGVADQTVGDFDDILMFTTRSTGRPFVGRYYSSGQTTIESDVAEVAWFVRGNKLHRRVLLVAPNVALDSGQTPFYHYNDISARVRDGVLTPNTLGNLTLREYRFAHPSGSFPNDARSWAWQASSNTFPTLPTMAECTYSNWTTETSVSLPLPQVSPLDMWTNSVLPVDAYAAGGSRVADDVILTNVIGFDVKAWDPVQNEYMDLGHGYQGLIYSTDLANGLSHLGNYNSQLHAFAGTYPSRVYDTWSVTYYGPNWNDGLDSNSNGVVDDAGEIANPPPYPIPLRGIQVKIRIFEPDSRQVREVTVEQDFLPR